jgi:cyclic pyranopterin phosphate synthase
VKQGQGADVLIGVDTAPSAMARSPAGMRLPTQESEVSNRYGCPVTDTPRLSHLDSAGRARMVDVGDKAESDRRARAQAVVRMSADTAAVVARGDAPKGDVLGTARIAGIQAAKRTAELIPLAHPLPLTFVDVDADIDADAGTITFVAEARTASRTGVEMEALTACAVAALTAYDMVKGMERGVVVEEVALLEKTGGKQDWRREG